MLNLWILRDKRHKMLLNKNQIIITKEITEIAYSFFSVRSDITLIGKTFVSKPSVLVLMVNLHICMMILGQWELETRGLKLMGPRLVLVEY